jgi:Meckel syndrome type 1 protein
VLFVRGVVACNPGAPVPRVRVEAELVRDGQVLAQGEVVAGAVPTPEEVWRATDRAGLEALSAELGKRAPKQVAAGDRLAFLVTLGDAPADLAGTSVRIRAGAEPR